MKTKKIMLICLAAITICSCTERIQVVPTPLQEHELVELRVRGLSQGGFKSRFCEGEDEVNSMEVMFYRDSVLDSQFHLDGKTGSVKVLDGYMYDVYALANVKDFVAPVNERDIFSKRYTLPGGGNFMEDGLPMACTVSKLVSKTTDFVLNLDFVRLVGKYSLSIDENLSNTDFRIESVRMCQSALDITPFKPNSKAFAVGDGDYATAADLELLSNGGKIDFYMLENCNGVLLKGNTDPWKKSPENMGGEAGKCTYLELETKWSTQGASADMTLRMYLGQDNCEDFNILRNTSTEIIVCLDDDLSYKTLWKANTTLLEDGRVLKFDDSDIVVWQCEDWAEARGLQCEPADLKYSVSVEGEGLKAKIENGKLYLKTEYFGDRRFSGKVKVSTWDGVHCDSSDVRVDYVPEPLRGYTLNDVQYFGEVGSCSFVDLDSFGPVDVTINDSTIFSVGSNNAAQYSDPESGILFAYNGSGDKFYYQLRGYDGGVSVKFTQKRRQEDVVLGSNLLFPTLTLYPQPVATEAGNSFYSEKLAIYYDSYSDVIPVDKDGQRIDMERFMAKQEYGFSNDPDPLGFVENNLAGGLRVWASTSAVVGINEDKSTAENSFSRLYFYGLAATEQQTTVHICGEFGSSIRRGEISVDLKYCPAFPSQGFLGNRINYQIAPGNMRSYTTSLGIYEDSPAPCSELSTWSIVHNNNHPDKMTLTVFDTADDDYNRAASVDKGVIAFEPMSKDIYPCCGGMKICATTTNPHNGLVLEGEYLVDLLLFCPIGIRQEYSVKGGMEYAPFCEYLGSGYRQNWKEHFPASLSIEDSRGDVHPLFSDNKDDLIPIRNKVHFTTAEKYATFLEQYSYMFDFRFKYWRNRIGGPDFTVDYISASLEVDSNTKTGVYGYYYFVRQRDIGNMSNKWDVLKPYANEFVMVSIQSDIVEFDIGIPLDNDYKVI